MVRFSLVVAGSLALAACGGEKGEQRAERAAGNIALASDASARQRHAEIPTRIGDEPFIGIMFIDDGTPVEVRYQKVGALAVAGGDMIVGRHDEMQLRYRLFRDLRDGDIDATSVPAPQRRILERFAQRLARAGEGSGVPRLSLDDLQTFGWGTTSRIWPTRTIPFEIGASIPPGPRRDEIMAAVAIWNRGSPVTLRPADQIPRAERRRTAILTFVDHEDDDAEFACASWVGYQPRRGRQEIYLNPSCAAGNIAHEIGHALGLHHEHQRADRTRFLTINANVPDDSVNYGTLRGRRLSDHDLCSIMHYGASTPPWYTLTATGLQAHRTCEQALAPDCRTGEPGQRCELSRGDVASIRSFYGI